MQSIVPNVTEDAHALELWKFLNVQDQLLPSDVIVGLGSYDEAVAEECARLWLQGMARKIIFTGKEGNWTAGISDCTEAELFARVAINVGVRNENIILEKNAVNIGQNIAFSLTIIQQYSWRRAIFVTKPQTTLRTKLVLNMHTALDRALVWSPRYTMQQYICKHGRHRLYNEMAGDIDRILKYPEKGFQASTAIPSSVLDAWHALKSMGFTDHLL